MRVSQAFQSHLPHCFPAAAQCLPLNLSPSKWELSHQRASTNLILRSCPSRNLSGLPPNQHPCTSPQVPCTCTLRPALASTVAPINTPSSLPLYFELLLGSDSTLPCLLAHSSFPENRVDATPSRSIQTLGVTKPGLRRLPKTTLTTLSTTTARALASSPIRIPACHLRNSVCSCACNLPAPLSNQLLNSPKPRDEEKPSVNCLLLRPVYYALFTLPFMSPRTTAFDIDEPSSRTHEKRDC